jgi:hypothetical protein
MQVLHVVLLAKEGDALFGAMAQGFEQDGLALLGGEAAKVSDDETVF